jgi:hypothetical protein
MAHKVHIPLGVKQLADKMTTALSSVTVQRCHRVQPRTGPSVTLPCRHRAGPSTGAFCYCTVLPKNTAQDGLLRTTSLIVLCCQWLGSSTGAFCYCTVLPRDEGPVQGLSVTVVRYQRNVPTTVAFWYMKALPRCNSHYYIFVNILIPMFTSPCMYDSPPISFDLT